MYKKITKINEAKDAMRKGVVCLSQPLDEKRYNFGYLTFNMNFTSTSTPLDILKQQDIAVDGKMLAGFYGEVFYIASMRAPDYGEYLQNIDFEDLCIDFSKSLYLLSNFETTRLVNMNEESDFPFSILVDDEIIDVNKKGVNENGEWIVSNFKKDFIEGLFEEREGYLILSESNGPIYLSKEKYKLINELGAIDFSILGIEKGTNIKVFPVLQILFDNEIVDTIILNTQNESQMKPTSENLESNELEDEYENIDSFQKQVDISEINEDYIDVEINFVDDIEENLKRENIFENDQDWDEELSLDDDFDDEIDLDDED